MFTSDQYELLDFGAGRKLERFGEHVLDRPSPAAMQCERGMPERWSAADARFEIDESSGMGPQRGRWQVQGGTPSGWNVSHGGATFELKLTDFGHVGLFAEQASCWDWIQGQVRKAKSSGGSEPVRVLNLFAYTGGSTLAAAAEGAVTHVDAAANIVGWARRNAELSGMAAAPVRWIVDDALKFARRELRRGRQYEGIVLDPPSYGHGSNGEIWKIEENLPELLAVCRELAAGSARFVLLTCHAPGYDAARLEGCLKLAGFGEGTIEAGDLWLTTSGGRRLHSGVFARMARE